MHTTEQLFGRLLTTRRRAVSMLAGVTSALGTSLLVGCNSDQAQSDNAAAPDTSTTDANADSTSIGAASAQEARENLAWWQDTIVYEAYP